MTRDEWLFNLATKYARSYYEVSDRFIPGYEVSGLSRGFQIKRVKDGQVVQHKSMIECGLNDLSQFDKIFDDAVALEVFNKLKEL